MDSPRQVFPLNLFPLSLFWELSYFIMSIVLTQGFITSQGLLGSAFDTNWDSSVPQAASTVGQGEGTCVALVGFLFGAVLDYISVMLPSICL